MDWRILCANLLPVDWPDVKDLDLDQAREAAIRDIETDGWLSDAKSAMYNKETHINDMAVARL